MQTTTYMNQTVQSSEFFKTLPKVASYHAYQKLIIEKKITVPFLNYEPLKLQLRVFLGDYTVALVTY